MRIKEVAAKTKLTERAIRLYEEEGLISPSVTDKNGRDFRDYSDADVKKLKTIASLRRALFTIDEIKTMESRPESIPSVVSAHRERMHIDFQNLEYLVRHIDGVDENAVATTDDLASAIFAPTVLSQSIQTREQTEPTEEEKILFSEQYERIYEKYFAENTGWDKRYSAALSIRKFFGRFPLGAMLKACGVLLIVLIIGAVICYGIADIEDVEYELTGVVFYERDYLGAEKFSDVLTEPFSVRVTAKHKNYLLRDDQIEAIMYYDYGEDYPRGFVVTQEHCKKTNFAVSKDEMKVIYSASLSRRSLIDRVVMEYEGAKYAGEVYASFDENMRLSAMYFKLGRLNEQTHTVEYFDDVLMALVTPSGELSDAHFLHSLYVGY